MIIRMNPQKIFNYSKQFAIKLEDYEIQIKKLENLLENIEKYWQGEDEVKLITYMKERHINMMREFYTILQDYQQYLAKVPNVYLDMDLDYYNKKIVKNEELEHETKL